MAIQLTSLVFSLAVFYMAFFAFRAYRKQKQYQSLLLAERTKAHFAKVRNELAILAQHSEVDVNSNYFKSVYVLTTRVMRNPESYKEIASLLKSIIFDIRSYKKNDAFQPTAPEAKIAKMMNEALGHIIINYSWELRLMRRLFYRRHSPGKFIRTVVKYFRIGHAVRHNLQMEREKLEADREINKFSQQLRNLGPSFYSGSVNLCS